MDSSSTEQIQAADREAVIAKQNLCDKEGEAVVNAFHEAQCSMDEAQCSMDEAQCSMDEAISAMRAGSPKKKVEQMFHVADNLAHQVRLQALACFFPKFSYDDDGEKDGEKNIHAMLASHATIIQALETEEYQVRIAPKHSGSLAMWTIENGFFQAKNSANNLFTFTSQVVFANVMASFCEGVTLEEKLEAATQKIALMIQECRGLCIGMEVVTCNGMTGEHGDDPLENYVVVTSICRLNENGSRRFFTASEVTAFCIRWGLLWNEAFVFTNPENFQKFCELHKTELVHGTDSSFLKQLRQIANYHIPAMQHSDVQGDVLEGVVVRLEPREKSHCSEQAKKALETFSLDTLNTLSQRLNQKWVASGHNKSIFLESLRPEIEAFWGANPIRKLSKEESAKALAELLASNPVGRIADLLRHLHSDPKCAKSIQYHGYTMDGKIFFILHVLHDETFKHFNKTKPAGIMPLYRGFSFWTGDGEMEENSCDDRENSCCCMFKAKFMPYMIRTFVMRNCGIRLNEAGPNGIQEYKASVGRYLKSWCSTPEQHADAVSSYSSYLLDWGRFLCSLMATGEADPFKNGYLSLIPVFEKWRASQQDDSSRVQYGGVIVITYPRGVPEGPKAFHEVLKDKFQNHVVILASTKDVTKTFEGNNIKNLVTTGTTVIIVISLCTDGFIRGIEDALSPVKNVAWWIHHGVSAIPLATMQPKDISKARAILPKWFDVLKTFENKMIPTALAGETISLEAGLESLLQSEPLVPQKVIEQLTSNHVSMPEPPARKLTRVTVITFPGIPGSGKTTISSRRVVSMLVELTGCTVLTLDGDEPELKKWSQLREHIEQLPPYDGDYIIIASKNAPPSWNLYQGFQQKYPGVNFVAVLPENDGTSTHPFDERYLALCMSRVVQRSERDHKGLFGIDAWSVSVMYYNFYKDMTKQDLTKALQVFAQNVVCLPIVSPDASPMPEVLKELILRCIADPKKVSTDEVIAAIAEFKPYIDTLSSPLESFENAFIEQVAACVNAQAQSSPPQAQSSLDYVAVFISEEGKNTLKQQFECTTQNPHATIYHKSNQVSSAEAEVLIGKQVRIVCDRVLTSADGTYCVLGVSSMSLESGEQVPCINKFAHITLRCPSGCASKSNLLPAMVAEGTATEIPLDEPLDLTGCVEKR